MIKTEGLCVRFSESAAIRYKDLIFEEGNSYAILGASGCGKSTLLNMISGILTPSEGKVWMDDECFSAWPQKQKDAFRIRRIGNVYQDFKLMENMNVQENIDILCLEGVDTTGKEAILSALGILPLKRRRVRSLSGGEKQRVAIARALVKKPDIILADEPTGNLNFETGKDVMAQFLQNTDGSMLIAVTHDERLAPMFDHVLNMNAIASFEGGRGKGCYA